MILIEGNKKTTCLASGLKNLRCLINLPFVLDNLLIYFVLCCCSIGEQRQK